MMILVILNIVGFLSVVAATDFLRIATFNTGLTPKVPEFRTRRELIGPALAHLQADVICLQEVWYSSDVSRILNHVTNTKYRHSFSALHTSVDQMTLVSPTEAPCRTKEFANKFLPCITFTCGKGTGQHDAVRCAERCGLLRMLPQECITCLVLSKPSDVAATCLQNAGNKYNVPGLLLLSNRPLKNVRMVPYVAARKKLFIPRSYISAEIDGLGTIACTHTTANLGTEYFEELVYRSWEEQNMAEARTLVSSLWAVPSAIILGDLNSSPEIEATNVTQDMPGAFQYLRSHGYETAYVDSLAICTWCTYNPLAHAQHNMILDHVLLKDLTTVGTMRIMDGNIPDHVFPYSDHFGIEVTVAIGMK